MDFVDIVELTNNEDYEELENTDEALYTIVKTVQSQPDFDKSPEKCL